MSIPREDYINVLLENSIINIRVAAKTNKISEIENEIQHFSSIMHIKEGIITLDDYMSTSRLHYLKSVSQEQSGIFNCVWDEIEKNKNDFQFSKANINEQKMNQILDLLKIATDNINDLIKRKKYSCIYSEIYHVHNVPSLFHGSNNDLLKYYLDIEIGQYVKSADKLCSKRFKSAWESLGYIDNK